MIKHVFFDFNGTIIDDLDLCLELLNKILKEQNKPLVSKERYKEIFTFPIKDYYKAAGVDFNLKPFEKLADEFIEEYQPRSMNVGLFTSAIPTFKFLKEKGINLYILSASEVNNLKSQCQNYDICKYFNAILGIDNIYAKSKVDIAKNYIKEHNINKDETIFIGDTLHDKEVADAIGVKCFLVSCGHQAESVLKNANVEIFSSIEGLKDNYNEIFN